jgi:hypothetical protein
MKLELKNTFPKALEEVEKVMIEGLEKYPNDDWSRRPIEEHIKHAVDHLRVIPFDVDIAKKQWIEDASHAATRVLMLLEILKR